MGKFIDSTGVKFGRLLVLYRVENDKHKKAQWFCQCDCGCTCISAGSDLRTGHTKSCGCLQEEAAAKTFISYNDSEHTVPSGPDHYKWDPSLTVKDRSDRRLLPENKEWAIIIKKRDNFICQRCQERGGELESHHILAYSRYPEARNDIDNGVTLCKPCHREFHKLYGTKKFTDTDYWEWLKDE